MSFTPKEMKEQLVKAIAQLKQNIVELEGESKKKTMDYENQQKLLVEESAERDFEEQKLNILKVVLKKNEEAIKQAKEELSKLRNEHIRGVSSNFQKFNAQRIMQFKELFEVYKQIYISEEEQLGNLEKFRRDINQQINETKSGIVLAEQEYRQTQDEMVEMQKHFVATVDCPDISPIVKIAIIESCDLALKCKRKNLLDLKMENHALKVKSKTAWGRNQLN